MIDPRFEGLKDIVSILESRKITTFLSAGTMLGIVRNHDFIPWDRNVSVGCIDDNFKSKINGLITEFRNKNFTGAINRKGEYFCIKLIRNKIRFIIENVIIIGKWATRPYYKIPAKFLKKTEYIKLQDIFFPCPHPAKEACAWQYGQNWRTPIKTNKRDDVINPEHHITKKDGINNKKLRTPIKRIII